MRTKVGLGGPAPFASDPAPDELNEDKELVLAFKRGEDGSYQAIYERYSPRVSGICKRMLDHSHDAEEASQETFMKVYTSLPKFNGRYQLGAWVSRIATNVCLDHIRSRGRKPADCASHEMLADLSADPGDNVPEEEFLKSAERQKVREVLATLSPSHRAALALREFEGMSYDDIAVALNMTEPQVKALIHRARKAFKKQWSPGLLAAFLPWRWVSKVRKFSSHYDTPPQVQDAAASTVHFATTCSTALQHCGQFVSERVVTTMTAFVVGAGAVGVAIAPSGDARPKQPVIHQEAVAQSSGDNIGTRKAPKSVVKPKEEKRVSAVAPSGPPATEEPAKEEEAPTAQPTAAPTTAPSEPQPTATPAPKQTAAPSGPTGPAPLYTYFGWQGDQATPRAQASSSTVRADCHNRSFTHEVKTMISHGAFSYPLSLRLEVSEYATRLNFWVRKDGRDITYSSWGAQPTVAWTQDGAKAHVEITGAYGALAGSDPDSAELPRSGHFDATLTLDCAAQSVVSVGSAFTAE